MPVGQGYVDSHWGTSLASDLDGVAHAALSHLDWLADRYAAVDNVFASESNRFGGNGLPT